MAQQVRDFPLNQTQIKIDSSNPQIAPSLIGQQNTYLTNHQNNQIINFPMNYQYRNDSSFFGIPISSHQYFQEGNQSYVANQQQQQFFMPQGMFNPSFNQLNKQQQSNYIFQNNGAVNQYTSPIGISAVRPPQNSKQKPTEINNDQKNLLNYNQLQLSRATSENNYQLNSPCIHTGIQTDGNQMEGMSTKSHSSVHSLEPQGIQNPNTNPSLANNKIKISNNNNMNINSLQPQAPSSQSSSTDQRRLKIQDFKVHECTKRDKHEKKKCPYYHNQGDRRRCPEKYQYSFNECKKKDKCSLKDNCPQVHNKVEQLYHPLRYKAKFCESFKENNQKCEYGNFCSFAHHESEIVIPMICKLPKDAIFYMYFYKTVWCPNTQKHERAYCPYMHNVQDFRRDPKQFQIEPKQCDQWKKSNIQKYSEGECPLQLKCKNCHGWKEYDYHPKFYKTKPCDTPNCQNLECVHYHSEQDRRIVTEELLKKEEKEAKEKLKSLINSNIPYDVKLGAPIDVFYTEQEEEMNNSNNGSNINLNQNMSYHSSSNNNNSNSNHNSKNSSNTDFNTQNNSNYNTSNNNQKNRGKSNTLNIQNNSYPQNRQQSNSQYGQQQNYYNNNQQNHDKGSNHQKVYDKKQSNFNSNNINNNNNYHSKKQQNNNNNNNNYQNFGPNNSNNNNNNNNNYNNSNNSFVDNYQKNTYQVNSSNNRQQQNGIFNQPTTNNNINNLNYLNNNFQNNFNPYQNINYCQISQNQSDYDQTTSSKSQSQQQSRCSSLGKDGFDQQTIINSGERRDIQINQQDIFFQFNDTKIKYCSELQKCFAKKSQTELYEILLHNNFNDEKILELGDNDNYQLSFLNDNQSNNLKNIIAYYNEEQDYKDIQQLVD